MLSVELPEPQTSTCLLEDEGNRSTQVPLTVMNKIYLPGQRFLALFEVV